MIEDMLKLTIDQVFPRNSKKKRSGIQSSSISYTPMKIKNKKVSVRQSERGKSMNKIEHEMMSKNYDLDCVDPDNEVTLL